MPNIDHNIEENTQYKFIEIYRMRGTKYIVITDDKGYITVLFRGF